MGNYCALEEVKDELGGENVGDTNNGMLTAMIEQASAFIDDFCHRVFFSEDGVKYYDGAKILHIDDLLSVTTLKLDLDGDGVFEATLAATDYILYPRNEFPKTMIKLRPNSSYGSFAVGVLDGVEIDGSWGYASTTPSPVKRAAIIQTCRWYKRKDSAFSDVIGSAEMGEIVMYKGLDPDVKLLLQPYVKAVFA